MDSSREPEPVGGDGAGAAVAEQPEPQPGADLAAMLKGVEPALLVPRLQAALVAQKRVLAQERLASFSRELELAAQNRVLHTKLERMAAEQAAAAGRLAQREAEFKNSIRAEQRRGSEAVSGAHPPHPPAHHRPPPPHPRLRASGQRCSRIWKR